MPIYIFADTIFCTPLENTTSAPGSQIPPVEVWYKDLVPNVNNLFSNIISSRDDFKTSLGPYPKIS